MIKNSVVSVSTQSYTSFPLRRPGRSWVSVWVFCPPPLFLGGWGVGGILGWFFFLVWFGFFEVAPVKPTDKVVIHLVYHP